MEMRKTVAYGMFLIINYLYQQTVEYFNTKTVEKFNTFTGKGLSQQHSSS